MGRRSLESPHKPGKTMRNAFALIVAAAAVIAFGVGLHAPDRSHERHMARMAAQDRVMQVGLAATPVESDRPAYERRFAPRVAVETAPQQDFEQELERVRRERDDDSPAAAREYRTRGGG
jgi:hypothetical protein